MASDRTASSWSSSSSKGSRISSRYSPTTDVLLDCPQRPSTAGGSRYDLRPYGKPSDIGKCFEGYGCKKKVNISSTIYSFFTRKTGLFFVFNFRVFSLVLPLSHYKGGR